MGIAMSGIAFGGLVMTPILGYSIQQIDWAPTAILLGLTLLILPVPFVYFIVKDHRIEKIGDVEPTKKTILDKIPNAMKTPSYWLAGAAFLLGSAATVGVIQHQASFLRDYASLAFMGKVIFSAQVDMARPIANNETELGREKNRRIDIAIRPILD